jgi:hypothetical protein
MEDEQTTDGLARQNVQEELQDQISNGNDMNEGPVWSRGTMDSSVYHFAIMSIRFIDDRCGGAIRNPLLTTASPPFPRQPPRFRFPTLFCSFLKYIYSQSSFHICSS